MRQLFHIQNRGLLARIVVPLLRKKLERTAGQDLARLNEVVRAARSAQTS